MRILPIFPDNWFYGLVDEMVRQGQAEVVERDPDAIVVGSISQMNRAFRAIGANPGVPVFAYNWDLYEWSRAGGFYDYRRWGRLMKKCRRVWHPSECTMGRATEWYGLKNGAVVKTFVPVGHLSGIEPSDGGYALMALRESPDPMRPWFERACEDLGIPMKSTDLAESQDEFNGILAGATFLVNPLREASTGGLFLIEGLYLGKPAVVSASPWNAGRDYLGPFAAAPKSLEYGHFRDALKKMWRERPTHDLAAARRFIDVEYSAFKMAGACLADMARSL